MKSKEITEFLLTPFGYPYPYRLLYVAQYRFVHQAAEFLVRRDNHQNITGGLAKSWTITPDRKRITFHLRPNLYSAEEVAQGLSRLIRAGQTSHSNLAAQVDVKDIVVKGPLELELTTKGDAGAVLAPLVMADAAILPDDHWISVPGFREMQVDWTKTKGPYIYVSGSFPLEEGQYLLFKPNPNHYFYEPEQLNWRLIYKPLEKIDSLATLKKMLDEQTGFTTIRLTELSEIYFSGQKGPKYYQTRSNGFGFLQPNDKSKALAAPEVRKTVLKRLRAAQIELIDPASRADQIPQPGLSGRLPHEDFKSLAQKLDSSPEVKPERPLIWKVAKGTNRKWIQSVADAVGLPYELKDGAKDILCEEWKRGLFDIQVASIGMSDTDPISGATFIFSPATMGLDLPGRPILNLLNSAKGSTDRALITETVRKAFAMAFENALIMPISYTANRHYHSSNVQLNIQDTFSESVRIWEVRVAD